MCEFDSPLSTVSWGATAEMSLASVIGLPMPLAETAEARTRRNSWFRRIRAKSLWASWGQLATLGP